MFAFILAVLVGLSSPLFADAGDSAETGKEQVKNVKVGTTNATTAWTEVMDGTSQEMSKEKSLPGQLTGLVSGSAVGTRRVIHRMGGAAIDLLTFWIPKKQALVSPETPPTT